MHVAVVLRLVPDIGGLEVDNSGADIDREWIGFKLNEFDDQALEQAVLLKEQHGAKVTAVTLKAEGADRVLQTAIARGADEVVRVDHDKDRVFAASQAASMLAGPLGEIGATVVLTGVQTPDDVFGQWAPMLAGQLGWPTVNAVSSVTVREGVLVARQEYRAGCRRFCRSRGPLFSVYKPLRSRRATCPGPSCVRRNRRPSAGSRRALALLRAPRSDR